MFKLKLTERSAKLSKKFLIISSMSAIILTVATYAWFTGMRTVSISSFNISIASTESLLVSLDGESWSESVDFTQDDIEQITDDENTNNWSKLVPLSTIGEMDINASRMKIYEQTSITASPGGYRLISKRVDNYNPGQKEQEGYIVFDLYFRNYSGRQYIKELNLLDEEAIYLNFDSVVRTSSDGISGTGIENTVRIAFAQIGRVIGTNTDKRIINSISCNPEEDSEVTGICRSQIWEPNDNKHVNNAINWYKTSCLARTGWDVTKKSSYNGSCRPISDGISYPTYAVKREITSKDNVNIYDGPVFNSYNNSALFNYPYFTDSMKLLEGIDRMEFMRLAPNSITKIRLYIYIEGQDIDNYSFAQLGKKISIRFGFTKERFTGSDVNYDGPPIEGGETKPEESQTPVQP